MSDRPDFLPLTNRIQHEINYFNGALPERDAMVWYGYLAALIEWGLLSPSQHQKLSDMLPKITDKPVMAVFLGRE